MFTIEAWVKLDTVDPTPNGMIMPIFGKYLSSNPANDWDHNYTVGIAMSNQFLRTYVNSIFYDV